MSGHKPFGDLAARLRALREAEERECELLSALRRVTGGKNDRSSIRRAFDFWHLRNSLR